MVGRHAWIVVGRPNFVTRPTVAALYFSTLKASLSPEARLAFLWQAGQALSSSLDYETTLRTVARLLVPTLADWAAVDLADEHGRLERLALVHADPERERWGWEIVRRYPPNPSGSGQLQVLETGAPLLIPEVTEEMVRQTVTSEEHAELVRGVGLSSVIIVPLTVRDQRLGTITLATSDSGRRYGSDELALAQELAARAAFAVQHARLYLAEQRARADAEAAAERTTHLLALSSALAGDLSAEDVATTSLAQALPALGAWAGSFFALSDDGNRLDLLGFRGYPDDLVEPWRHTPIDARIPLTDAIREGKPIFVETPAQWLERYPHLEAARSRTDSRAIASVPLVSHGRAIGVIGISFRGERTFSVDDREFMLILAGHCAQALDRVLAARALQESEARFRTVVESGMLGIAFWNGERVTDANAQLLDLLGYTRDDVEQGRLRHGVLTPPEYEPADARAYAECQARGICRPYEKEFLRKDGSRVPVLVGGSLLGGDVRRGVFFVLDLTDRRRAEAQVQAAQRMEAVGRLAGGVAHEINNALQGVLGFAGFLRRSLPPGDTRVRDVAEIERAGTRAADITHQLLAFSRRQVRQPAYIDVGQVTAEFAPMLQQALGPERTLELSTSTGDGTVHVDRGQLEQVLLNLTLNARDATSPGGRLAISVEGETIAPAAAGRAPTREELEQPPPGDYVRIAVRDTGTGMGPGVRERVFEPFFTTKEPGKGTGLGLSVVYGIVRQSGGFISVESEPGRGSTFRIHLPAAARPDEAPRGPSGTTVPSGGTETVLVVDDEPSVLAVATRALTEAGYRVAAASNGAEALAVLSRRDDVALVLSDVLMPVLGGEELARRLESERPQLPLLLTSGHPDSLSPASRERRRIIYKPFSPEELLQAVRETLDATGAARSS